MGSPAEGRDQPKIYVIWNHAFKVLRPLKVIELYAVRVVCTPRGLERHLHLKVRLRSGKNGVMTDVLVDTGAQVSVVQQGVCPEECVGADAQPVRLQGAIGKTMGGGTQQAKISVEIWEHDCLNRPDLAKGLSLSGNFDTADITHGDLIISYDFIVIHAIGALPGLGGIGGAIMAAHRPQPREFSLYR